MQKMINNYNKTSSLKLSMKRNRFYSRLLKNKKNALIEREAIIHKDCINKVLSVACAKPCRIGKRKAKVDIYASYALILIKEKSPSVWNISGNIIEIFKSTYQRE